MVLTCLRLRRRARKVARLLQKEIDDENLHQQEREHRKMVRLEEERIRNAQSKKAVEDMKEEMRKRIELFNKNNEFTCPRKGCEGRVFKKRVLFQLHEKMHFNEDKKAKAIEDEKKRLAKIRLGNEQAFLQALKEGRESRSLDSGYAGESDADSLSASISYSGEGRVSSSKGSVSVKDKVRKFKWTVIMGKLVRVPILVGKDEEAEGEEILDEAPLEATADKSNNIIGISSADVVTSGISKAAEEESTYGGTVDASNDADDVDVDADVNVDVDVDVDDMESSSTFPSLSTFDLTLDEETKTPQEDEEDDEGNYSFASLSDDDTLPISNKDLIPKKTISIYGKEVDDYFRATSPTSFTNHINHLVERPTSPSIPDLFLNNIIKNHPDDSNDADASRVEKEHERMLLENSIDRADLLLSQRSFVDDNTITSSITDPDFDIESEFLSARLQQSEQDFLSARSNATGIELEAAISELEQARVISHENFNAPFFKLISTHAIPSESLPEVFYLNKDVIRVGRSHQADVVLQPMVNLHMIGKIHMLVYTSWNKEENSVTVYVRDNKTKYGTFWLNKNGVKKCPGLTSMVDSDVHMHHGDKLMLCKDVLSENAPYEIVYQLNIPNSLGKENLLRERVVVATENNLNEIPSLIPEDKYWWKSEFGEGRGDLSSRSLSSRVTSGKRASTTTRRNVKSRIARLREKQKFAMGRDGKSIADAASNNSFFGVGGYDGSSSVGGNSSVGSESVKGGMSLPSLRVHTANNMGFVAQSRGSSGVISAASSVEGSFNIGDELSLVEGSISSIATKTSKQSNSTATSSQGRYMSAKKTSEEFKERMRKKIAAQNVAIFHKKKDRVNPFDVSDLFMPK